ncbi:MAG: hypothetical protein ACP5QH_06125 [Thermoplasmata archaeon]
MRGGIIVYVVRGDEVYPLAQYEYIPGHGTLEERPDRVVQVIVADERWYDGLDCAEIHGKLKHAQLILVHHGKYLGGRLIKHITVRGGGELYIHGRGICGHVSKRCIIDVEIQPVRKGIVPAKVGEAVYNLKGHGGIGNAHAEEVITPARQGNVTAGLVNGRVLVKRGHPDTVKVNPGTREVHGRGIDHGLGNRAVQPESHRGGDLIGRGTGDPRVHGGEGSTGDIERTRVHYGRIHQVDAPRGHVQGKPEAGTEHVRGNGYCTVDHCQVTAPDTQVQPVVNTGKEIQGRVLDYEVTRGGDHQGVVETILALEARERVHGKFVYHDGTVDVYYRYGIGCHGSTRSTSLNASFMNALKTERYRDGRDNHYKYQYQR